MGQPKTEGQTKKGKCPLTDLLHHGGINSLGGIIPAFEFEVTMWSPNLWIPPYSPYQQRLFNQILIYRNQGKTFKEISVYFNQLGMTSNRGSRFTPPLVHALYKKGMNRKNRIETKVRWILIPRGMSFMRL